MVPLSQCIRAQSEEDQRKEEAETKKIFSDHERKQCAPSDSAKAPSIVGSQALKTRCHSKTGIVEIGVQVSGSLAKCRHCLQPISKGSARVGWAYSLVKFQSWVHTGCFAELLESEQGDKQAALDFLVEWQSQNGNHVAAPDIQEIVQALTESSASARASSSTGQ